MRPPNDLPEAQIGSPGEPASAARSAAASVAARPVALALDAAGGAIELTAAVGDLVDASGSALDGIGGVFEVFGP